MSHNIRIKGSLYGDPVGFAKRIAFWMNWLQPEALAMRARRTIRVEEGADFYAMVHDGWWAPCLSCGSGDVSAFMTDADGPLNEQVASNVRECASCGATETP